VARGREGDTVPAPGALGIVVIDVSIAADAAIFVSQHLDGTLDDLGQLHVVGAAGGIVEIGLGGFLDTDVIEGTARVARRDAGIWKLIDRERPERPAEIRNAPIAEKRTKVMGLHRFLVMSNLPLEMKLSFRRNEFVLSRALLFGQYGNAMAPESARSIGRRAYNRMRKGPRP
jgi:hypothetical protein